MLQLFDLMGFDRFELIQTLLEHRKDIVQGVSLEIEKKNLSSKTGNVDSLVRYVFFVQPRKNSHL